MRTEDNNKNNQRKDSIKIAINDFAVLVMPLRGTGWISLPFRSSEVLEFSTAKWRVVAWSLLLRVEVNESRPKVGVQVIDSLQS